MPIQECFQFYHSATAHTTLGLPCFPGRDGHEILVPRALHRIVSAFDLHSLTPKTEKIIQVCLSDVLNVGMQGGKVSIATFFNDTFSVSNK